MSATPEYECAVCPNLTNQCCSGCKRLYFCSRECQKLIWPSHKALCGADPEVFQLAPLSDQEICDIEAIRDEPFALGESGTLSKSFMQMQEETTARRGWEAVKSEMQSPCPATAPDTTFKDSRDMLILQGRTHLSALYRREGGPNDRRLSHVWQHMNLIYGAFSSAFAFDVPKLEYDGPKRMASVLAPFLHHFLICQTLLSHAAAFDTEDAADRLFPLLELAIKRSDRALNAIDLPVEVKEAVEGHFSRFRDIFLEED